MELKEAIQQNKKLSDIEKEIWIERLEELQSSGMAPQEVSQRIIAEMQEDTDKDLVQLKKGLGQK